MIFSEKTEVLYNNMSGVIDFVCNNYVVVKLDSKSNFSSPRLIVYRENYKDISILKASEK